MGKDNISHARGQSALATNNGDLRQPQDKVLDALRAAQLEPVKCRGGWKARCPAHDDSTPSLDMKVESDGKVLVICRSQGCSFAAIAAALGLEEADFFPHPIVPGKSKAKRRTDFVHPVAVYLYENPDGSPRFQVRRFNVFEDGVIVDKDFRQYRPDGAPGLGDVEPILYHLPELLSADPNRPVMILEGEKDVDNVRSLGRVATCNPMGASKWKDCYAESLRGRICWIIPDNDQPGRDHALQVARSLLGIAASVKIVDLVQLMPDLKEKGDVSDFLDAGGTLNEVEELARETAEWIPTEIVVSSDDEDDDCVPIKITPWPDPPGEEAYHGLLGKIVKTIAPQTESDPLAILANVVIFFGNIIGRSAYLQIEATRHYLNEYAVIVGQSAIGRKGTASDWAKHVFSTVDGLWGDDRIQGGLSSGEGLISAVRDPTEMRTPVKEKGKIVDYQITVSDPGIEDKRLMVVESEFGGVLKAIQREGNKLTSVIRLGWDTGLLRSMTKSPYKATDAHISITTHITLYELQTLLSVTDTVNGFANRFLWFLVRRQGSLPFGGNVPDLSLLCNALDMAVGNARGVTRIGWTDAARPVWSAIYDELFDVPPGLLGEILSRGQPHVRRLAAIYAVADGKTAVDVDHLLAAKALWDSSARSVRYIFGNSLGNKDAEKLLQAIVDAGRKGLSRKEISVDVFQRNKPMDTITGLLALLMENSRVHEVKDCSTGGRRTLRYFAFGVTPSTN
jgi:hypothetical protein